MSVHIRKSLVLAAAIVASGLSLPPLSHAEEGKLDTQHELLTAWDTFCDSLKLAGRDIIARSGGSELNTAEGFQYLAMLTGVGIERSQHYDSHEFPVVARNLDTYKKLGLDSSDNTYRMVSFEPGGSYRIRGWRGNSTYLGFQVNAGRAAVANLNDSEIEFNADGSFEIYFSPEMRGVNWFELPSNADNMYIREIFIDWQAETPTRLWVERLDKFGQPPPLTTATMQQRLAEIGAYVSDNIRFWDGYVSRSRENNFNRFAKPRGTTGEGGSADNTYSGGYFSIAPDEALIVEVEPVQSLFWNVQLGNRWFQSLDYQYRQTSMNNRQAKPDADGKYTIVIAHEDPGVANWLDTAGHSDGVMYFRWNQADNLPDAPQVTKVDLADIGKRLPPTMQRITPEERRKVLQQRYEGVARRFAL